MQSDFVSSIQPVVLVGGKSRRFTRDKLVEPVGGSMLVEFSIRALREVFGPRIALVGECSPEVRKLAEQHLPDRFQNAGPLGGIVTALQEFQSPIFVLAGDMPNIRSEHVRAIAVAASDAIQSKASDSPPLAIWAQTDLLQPCTGIYLPASLPILNTRILQSELQLHDAFPPDRILAVSIPFPAAANVNSLHDL